jgi:DNA/RNA non-specific endonuclease
MRSGYDRGHMCPAADNHWSQRAMEQSFLMTNVCPQNPALNSGLWNSIENQCRTWAEEYGDVYIVCGPIYLNQKHKTIGKNKVQVPEAFFKVILRLKDEPKAIGFICRNVSAKGHKKTDYVNTVDEVERITGMDFFSQLPDNIERRIEGKADIKDWN